MSAIHPAYRTLVEVEGSSGKKGRIDVIHTRGLTTFITECTFYEEYQVVHCGLQYFPELSELSELRPRPKYLALQLTLQ